MRPATPCARFTAVTSGKDGVGKSVLAANLSAALAARGCRVLVLEAFPGSMAAQAVGATAARLHRV